MAEPEPVFKTPWWQRMLVVHLLQVPAILLAIWGEGNLALILAGLWGASVCCGGTDSRWRIKNKLLLLEAAAWLVWLSLMFIPDLPSINE